MSDHHHPQGVSEGDSSTPPSTTTATTTARDEEPKPRPPWRLAIVIPLAAMLWIAPYIAGIAVLLPAKLEIVAPDQKIEIVATLAMVGSLVALIANIIFGALSDLTRSRLGRRTPWLILGSVASAILLYLLSIVTNIALIIVIWCAFQFFLNAIVAPLIAVIPDRVPTQYRGTYSAIYGVGAMVGASLAGIIASRFVTNPEEGFVVFAAAILLSGPIVAIFAPDTSNKAQPRLPFSKDMLLQNFSFPRHGARDFYLALVGKLLFVLAVYMISGYQLYIATDYLGLDALGAGALIATMATVQLVVSLIFGLGSGPVSDKIGRRKMPVVVSTLVMAVALFVPFVWQEPGAMILFAGLGMGAAWGVFASVDQALNYEVLPDPESSAKDLGILNMANTGGQMLGPVVMSFVI
ncbi:MAG: MFS transporter, partial [Pauljensenia sp.]